MAADDRMNDVVAAIVDARMAWATVLAPRALSSAEAELVRARIEESVTAGLALRRVPLANGDEPGLVFIPCRAADDHANAGHAR